MSGKKSLAILGGGTGSLIAALEVTGQPSWRERYREVVVYQMGHRLGGKGASGRSGPNARIQEHGLHIWMGCYDNAFRMMRRVYEELGRPAGTPLARWDDAFKPHDYVGVAEEHNGAWRTHWLTNAPRNAFTPGEGELLLPITEQLRMLLDLQAAVLDGLASEARSEAQEAFSSEQMRAFWWRNGLLGSVLLLRRLLGTISKLLGSGRASGLSSRVNEVLTLLAARRGELLAHDETRRLSLWLELVLTLVLGLARDGVLSRQRSLDDLDKEDLREWLGRHGMSARGRDSSLLRGLYDLVFGYVDGDPARPAFAAGVAIRTVLRMWTTYKGAIFWEMQAGMGDVVYAPIYEVLRRRGVRFEFFHRVEALRVHGRQISAIEFTRQATPRDATYDPLIDVNGLPCWPEEPVWDRLVEGEQLRGLDLEAPYLRTENMTSRTLRLGQDFDEVVLGIPVGAHPAIAQELMAANPRYAHMVNSLGTVATMAMQLWFEKSITELGDYQRPLVLDAFAQRFNTWADMTHTSRYEAWPARTVRHVAYLCGPMTAPVSSSLANDEDALRIAREEADRWLREDAHALWPKVTTEGQAAPLGLHACEGFGGGSKETIDAQYFRANTRPSERYVLSLPGTTEARLAADESGFDNLVLAGDWTRNGFNAGCIEAAVMSGMQASHALTGYPLPEQITGWEDELLGARKPRRSSVPPAMVEAKTENTTAGVRLRGSVTATP